MEVALRNLKKHIEILNKLLERIKRNYSDLENEINFLITLLN